MRGIRPFFPLLLSILALPSCGKEEAPPSAPAETGAAGTAAAPAPQEPSPALGPREADMSVLRVKVVTAEDGAPLAGIRVRLLWKSGREETDVGRIYQTTGPDGIARFDILGGTIVQSVAAEPSPLTAPAAKVIKAPIQPAKEVDLELKVRPGATVAGIVRDPDGNPVPDAEVRVWFAERWEVENEPGKPFDISGRTREHGDFTLGGLPAGDFLIEARKEGMIATRRVAGKIRTGQVLDGFELILTPAEPFYGRVVDEDGNPIAGAELRVGVVGRFSRHEETPTPQALYVPAAQYLLTSDEDGSFTVPARNMDEMWVAEARHPDFMDARLRLLPGEGSGDVVMEYGFSLRGQVVDAERDPVPRARLVLRGEQERRFRSGEGGGFRVNGLKEDLEAAVLAYKPGYRPALLWPVEIGPDAEALRLQLLPGLGLEGRILTAGGEPAAGLRVEIVEETPTDPAATLPFPGDPPLAEFGLDHALSSAEGRFVFADLPEGPLSLRVLDPDGRVLAEAKVQPGGEPVEIVLP
ncbi:MAG: carboxypeptidase regulatory-like domain-containing protein [Planctomycetota bacterium]|nr:MAG: carboxypeptidase regulatory-like domain-containing protein [Planctomycetota bacterium]